MTRGKRLVIHKHSSSSVEDSEGSEEIEVSKEFEESKEERSPSPQPVVRRQWESMS